MHGMKRFGISHFGTGHFSADHYGASGFGGRHSIVCRYDAILIRLVDNVIVYGVMIRSRIDSQLTMSLDGLTNAERVVVVHPAAHHVVCSAYVTILQPQFPDHPRRSVGAVGIAFALHSEGREFKSLTKRRHQRCSAKMFQVPCKKLVPGAVMESYFSLYLLWTFFWSAIRADSEPDARPLLKSHLPVPLLLPIASSGLTSKLQDTEHDNTADVSIPGDIVLGGLFPIHEDGSPEGRHCGAIKPDKGIQRMEAMLFALDQINRENTLLPGLKLGAHILDTCNQDTHGLEQTLKFIKFSLSQENLQYYSCPNNTAPFNKAPKPVPAVIGAASSQVSAMVANVLRLFRTILDQIFGV
uniref:Receptor ligand binding region domain-containing protein n=1 Tax=Romanomermis culicivorax TaxID=13658 RepID=A0A915IIG2_ROMCU